MPMLKAGSNGVAAGEHVLGISAEPPPGLVRKGRDLTPASCMGNAQAYPSQQKR